MVSTLLKKNGEPFFAKKLKRLHILYDTILFKFHQHMVQIRTNNVWRYFRPGLSTSSVSVSDSNIKCPIRKAIFAVKLPLEFFRATVANAKTGSLKSLHTLFETYLVTCWWNLNQFVWFEMYKFVSFLTKNGVFKNHFGQSVKVILQDVSEAETIVNGKLLIFRILSFSVPKIIVVQHL